MKKIIFAIAALFVMVCTAVSLTSCGSDEESTTMDCYFVWDYPGSAATPSSEAAAIISQLKSKTYDIVGESFSIPYTKKDEQLIVDGDALDIKLNAVASNSEIQTLVKKLQAMGYPYVYLITKCGDYVVDTEEVAY